MTSRRYLLAVGNYREMLKLMIFKQRYFAAQHAGMELGASPSDGEIHKISSCQTYQEKSSW